MELRSPAFGPEDPIPLEYSRDGGNRSPPLRWTGVPDAARALALVMENVSGSPDTAQWVLYHLSPGVEGLPEGFMHKQEPEEPVEATHGTNDEGNIGYDGPLGSVGLGYRYRFRLFALDRELDLDPGADEDALMEAMTGHILEEAELTARYERPR